LLDLHAQIAHPAHLVVLRVLHRLAEFVRVESHRAGSPLFPLRSRARAVAILRSRELEKQQEDDATADKIPHPHRVSFAFATCASWPHRLTQPQSPIADGARLRPLPRSIPIAPVPSSANPASLRASVAAMLIRPSIGQVIEQDEIKGFARTITEIEWLLLILVLIYLVAGGPAGESRSAITMALCFFGAFILALHYVEFYRQESLTKLAVETWVMIVFITWVVFYAGKIASPLLNLYLLPIIAAALILGKLM